MCLQSTLSLRLCRLVGHIPSEITNIELVVRVDLWEDFRIVNRIVEKASMTAKGKKSKKDDGGREGSKEGYIWE
jgi:hypothetical protein